MTRTQEIIEQMKMEREVETAIEREEFGADRDAIISAMDKMFANKMPVDNRAKMAEFMRIRNVK